METTPRTVTDTKGRSPISGLEPLTWLREHIKEQVTNKSPATREDPACKEWFPVTGLVDATVHPPSPTSPTTSERGQLRHRDGIEPMADQRPKRDPCVHGGSVHMPHGGSAHMPERDVCVHGASEFADRFARSHSPHRPFAHHFVRSHSPRGQLTRPDKHDGPGGLIDHITTKATHMTLDAVDAPRTVTPPLRSYSRMSDRVLVITAVNAADHNPAAMAALECGDHPQLDSTPDSIMAPVFRAMHDAMPESEAQLRAELTHRAEKADAREASVEPMPSSPEGTSESSNPSTIMVALINMAKLRGTVQQRPRRGVPL